MYQIQDLLDPQDTELNLLREITLVYLHETYKTGYKYL